MLACRLTQTLNFLNDVFPVYLLKSVIAQLLNGVVADEEAFVLN